MNNDERIFVGRFQPPLNHEVEAIRKRVMAGDEVLVILDGDREAPALRVPFTSEQREQMIRGALGEDARRVRFARARERRYDDAAWRMGLLEGLAALGVHEAPTLFEVFSERFEERLHRVFPEAHIDLVQEPAGCLQGHELRYQIFVDQRAEWIQDIQISAFVRDWIYGFLSTEQAQEILKDGEYIRTYKKEWANTPYPPVFVTVDTVVRHGAEVLLIRRNGSPGKGRLALPGGFLDQHEWTLDGMLRELQEETQLSVDRSKLLEAVRASRVFDHPWRSVRGRTITNAFYLDLDSSVARPAVQASDDAAQALWIKISELRNLEHEFFEDHLEIIEYFIRNQLKLSLELEVQPGRLSVCRLNASSELPDWATKGGFCSVTRTADELSIVCAEALVPGAVRAETGWVSLKVKGPLDFSLTGVMAALVDPLAIEAISVFTISTFDTDYVLIKQDRLEQAIGCLRRVGHRVVGS